MLAPLSGWILSIAMLGQAPAALPPSALPELIATKDATFAIPFRVDKNENSARQPVEVQLLVSADRGARWQLYSKVPATQQQFLFRAKNDGEYWFAIRTLDRAGQMRPEQIFGPSLRVLVDSKRPALKVNAQRNTAGDVTLHWETDKAIKPKSLSIEQRGLSDAAWQPVPMASQTAEESGAAQSGDVTFTPKASGDIEVRVEVSDTAGNAAIAQVQVKGAAETASPMNAEPRGSVAIAINPAIGSKYPALERSAGSGDMPSGLPPGERPRMVNSRAFELEYDIDSVGPSGIGRVELWGTRDSGRTWNRFTVDQDNRSPLRVTVDEEGMYGFRVVVTNGAGFGGKGPQGGDLPDLWVGVDVTKPVARIISTEQGTDAEAGYLIVTWQADDRMLAARPVSLSFSQSQAGPWLPIASGLENTGRYAWPLDSRATPQFFLRLEVRDEAGNVGVYQSSEPITIDQSRPTIRVRDVRPVNPLSARPVRRS